MRALLPHPADQVDDRFLLQSYSSEQRLFVRFNFVSSIDGSAQVNGLSKGLGSPADGRIFALLRRLASVILVGAGTVRAEGYEGQLLADEDISWRVEQGMAPQPVLALISRGLNLEPNDPVFVQSPVPVLLFTSVRVTSEQRQAFGPNTTLVQVSETDGGCDPQEIIAYLQAQGHGFIHAEGGPHIFGQFAAAGVVDSACISYSPAVVAGDGMRIAAHGPQTFQSFDLHALFEEDSMLFCDYRLKKSAGSPQG
ncbi:MULTISPECIES: dihydrofolate reductase family protein [Glutamicibacter]|jgi:riboflavin biosynthesis pyrimidine reductase|uniref:dihydrofolate reductase family protein n=1 Tax=Glutamicibacter TaxID=1742989 RepID=UPI003A8F057D